MSKRSCDMAADLLPLYAENMCSEESRAFVAEHLAECDACRQKLQKMNTAVSVRPDDDITTIKRIKKRIRIEKLVIAGVAAAVCLLGGWFTMFFLTSTACDMDYDKSIAGHIRVEEEEDGDLWLVREDTATAADTCFPTIRDGQGRHMGYDKDFDKETKNGYGITFQWARFKAIAPLTIPMPTEERTFLFNKNEKPAMQEVFYYDANSKTEYTLWERS
ncbi:MAG: zf-HC2 domain-containing protein [Oscillospiraceae bacterium]|nr:zf-HC2 domain-containing protein [Oscillospiraceae bacterium]